LQKTNHGVFSLGKLVQKKLITTQMWKTLPAALYNCIKVLYKLFATGDFGYLPFPE